MVGLNVGIRELSVVASTVLGASEVARELEAALIFAYKVSRILGGASRRLRRRRDLKRDSRFEPLSIIPPQKRPESPGHGKSQRPFGTRSAESNVSAA